MAKKAAAPEKVTRKTIEEEVAERVGATRKVVKLVIETLGFVIEEHLSDQKPLAGKPCQKIPVIPGKISVFRAKRPATKERIGLNPSTGEQITIAAKKARVITKAFVHKALKDA